MVALFKISQISFSVSCKAGAVDLICNCSHLAVFIKIVESVLAVDRDKFQLPSPVTIIKQIIIQWSKDVENMGHLTVFAKHLETELRSCRANVKSSTGKLRKEKLWGLYTRKEHLRHLIIARLNF